MKRYVNLKSFTDGRGKVNPPARVGTGSYVILFHLAADNFTLNEVNHFLGNIGCPVALPLQV